MKKSQYESNMNYCPYAPLSTEAGQAHFAILNCECPATGIRIENIEMGCELHYFADGSAIITHPAGGDESFAFSGDAEDRIMELKGQS